MSPSSGSLRAAPAAMASWCGVMGAVVAVLLAWAGAEAAPKPNILFIVADDLGYNDLGLFNGNKTHTPYLNRMIQEEGMWLSDYYTYHICAPTRVSLMTGRYPWRAGYYDMTHDTHHCAANYTFFAELLQGAGYATHAIGKYDVGFIEKECTPTYRGFDTFLGYYTACTRDYWYHGRPGAGTCNGTDFSNSSGLAIQGATMAGPGSVNGTYDRSVFSDRAVQLIEGRNKTQPLAIYLAFHNVHDACTADRHKDGLNAPKASVDLYDTTILDTWKVQAAMTTELDYGVGNVTEALIREGLYDNTLIVFVSDNGGPLDHSTNAPLRGGKATMWEGGFRVSAFVGGGLLPAHLRGTRYAGMVHSSDWYPTLVAGIARIPIPAHTGPRPMDGLNLWLALSAGGASPRQSVVHRVHNQYSGKVASAIRVGRYKLIVGPTSAQPIKAWPEPAGQSVPFGRTTGYIEPGTDHCHAALLSAAGTSAPSASVCDPYCLFDLEQDLSESTDLAKDPSYRTTISNMVALLTAAANEGPPRSLLFPGNKTVDDFFCQQCKAHTFLEPLDWLTEP